MLNRIEKDVIHVPPPIFRIANLMFPKSALPKKFFASIGKRGRCATRNEMLNQSPTRRKIVIGFRQSPNAMQMIGKYNNCIDAKWSSQRNIAKRFAQSVIYLGFCQPRSSVVCHNGKKITPTALISPPIVAHRATIIKWSGSSPEGTDPPVFHLMVDPLRLIHPTRLLAMICRLTCLCLLGWPWGHRCLGRNKSSLSVP